MSDLISRQAAIDAISCNIVVTGRQNAELVAATIGTFADRIKALPSTDRWIPCTERLPEIERDGQRRGWYITTNGYGCVSLTQYEFYHDFLKTGWQSDIQIIAWMPLPEPYKGGAEE